MTNPEVKIENDFILSGSLNKGIFKLAGPAIVSMVSIMLFEFVDLFWIGRLGSEAVAALGAASFVIWTVKSLANCVSSGINAIIARYAGANADEKIQLWASQGIVLTALFSLLITAILLIINNYLFFLIGLEDVVAQMAFNYTFILSLGIILIYESFSLDTIFRSLGNTFIPMIVMVATLTLNGILDPFFIYGWCGFPALGMPGGAVASVISHFVGVILFLMLLPKVRVKFTIIFRNFIKNSREMLRIGLPIGLLGAIFSMIYLVLSKNIAYFGTVPMAAISACHRIEGLTFFICLGFSMAVSTFVGQNLGHNNPDRAEKAVYLALLYSSGFMLLLSCVFIFRGRSILHLFVTDFAVIEEGYRYLFAISIFEVFLAPEVVLEGAFTGAGDTKPPFLISFPLTFLRIPLSYLFSVHYGFGVSSIWWVIGFTTFLKGTTMLYWFSHGKWKIASIGYQSCS